jgi:hypothetical protein
MTASAAIGIMHMMVRRPMRFTPEREDQAYCLAEIRYQHWFRKCWPLTKRYWSARWSIAADKDKRQTSPVDDLGDPADAATGNVYIENGKVKNGRLCQGQPVFDVARLRNHAMPKLFHHFGEHHPDQCFIFYQEYGRFGHFSPLPRCIGN